MSKSFFSILPDHEALLALEPEELAGVVLEYLNSLSSAESGNLNRYNFSLPHTVEGYPRNSQDKISQALMEAWVWLEREGLVVPQPGDRDGWVFISRRGKKIANASGLESYRRGDILPRRMLHPIIAQKVWSAFIRGDYDTAVFQAFKEVEVRVREVGGFHIEDIGAPLMRKAFCAKAGPLTDKSLPVAERESLAHLFAGSIGLYKNPHSHRNVSITPTEAAEAIVLASHLLKIVDSRADDDTAT